jgi:hypothetical protein
MMIDMNGWVNKKSNWSRLVTKFTSKLFLYSILKTLNAFVSCSYVTMLNSLQHSGGDSQTGGSEDPPIKHSMAREIRKR